MKNKNLTQRLLKLFYQNGFTDADIETLLQNREIAHLSTSNAYSKLVTKNIIGEDRFEYFDKIEINKEPINVDFFINNTVLAKEKMGFEYRSEQANVIKSIRRFSQPGTIRVYKQKHNADIADFIRFAEKNGEQFLGLPGIILFNEKTDVTPKRDLVISVDPGKKLIFTLNQKTFVRDITYKYKENFVSKKMTQDNLFISFVPAKYDT